MSLDEIKCQVKAAIERLFLFLKNEEHEALDFVISLVRVWIDAEVFAQLSGRIGDARDKHKQDEQASRDCSDDCSISPATLTPDEQLVPKKRKKLKKTSTRSKELTCGNDATHAVSAGSCRLCRRTFTDLAEHNEHTEHTEHACSAPELRRPPVCPHCAREFSKWSNVRAHVRRSARCGRGQSAERSCPHCRLRLPSQRALDAHRASSHAHKCSKCSQVFATVALMKAHRGTHVRIHTCNKCDKTFQTRQLLRKHRQEPHDDPPKPKLTKVYRCEQCGWQTSRSHNLKRHSRCAGHAPAAGAAPEPPPRFQCDRCPAALRSLASLNTHLAAHSQESLYVCDDCRRGFKYKTTLRRHVVTRHGAGGGAAGGTGRGRYECPRCDAAFRRRDNLRRHEREVHGAVKKSRKAAQVRPGAAGVAAGGAAGGAGAEPQFLSLLDVQSGEMFSVPSQYAYNLLMDGGGGGAEQPALPQYPQNMVLLTNVPQHYGQLRKAPNVPVML